MSTPKVPRGTARKLRRAAGNYTPVNAAASLQQAPTSRFARQGGTVPTIDESSK
jgi:hypothetical protein